MASDFLRFVRSVEFSTGRKRGRHPVFNSNRFYPHAIERELSSLAAAELARFVSECTAAAVEGLPVRDDMDDLSRVPDALPADFVASVEEIAGKMRRKASTDFADWTEMIVGKPYYPPEAREEIFATWSANFQTLCKSAEADAKKDISLLVSSAKNEGWNRGRLEKAVRERLPSKYRARAENIARTELGKLNSAAKLSQFREVGISYYRWLTTIDGRERDSHRSMNGLICSVSDPGVYYTENPDDPLHPVEHPRTADMFRGNPGEDFQCRCSMVAWDPEIDGMYEVRETPEKPEEEKGPETSPESAESARLGAELEKARREREEAEAALKSAENEKRKAIQELKAFKAKNYNLEKALAAERAEQRETLVEIVNSLADSVDTETVNKLTIPSLKAITTTIPSTFSKVGLNRFKRIAGISGEAILGYDDEILFVNTVSFNNVTANPKEFFKESVKRFAKRYGLREFAIDSPGQVNSHLVNHEIGHFVFGKYRSRGNTPDELTLIKKEMVKTGEIDLISHYAKIDPEPEELFAECFAMYLRAPTSLPKKMLDFIKKVINGILLEGIK